MNLFEKYAKDEINFPKKKSENYEQTKTSDFQKAKQFDSPIARKLEKEDNITSFETKSTNYQSSSTKASLTHTDNIDTNHKKRKIDTFNIIDAHSLLKRKQNLNSLPLGVAEIDSILDGGIEAEAITELYGAFASGKTQWCFQLIVNLLLSTPLDTKVVYVDTEKTFKVSRILQMLAQKNINDEEILKRVYIVQLQTSQDQLHFPVKLKEHFHNQKIGLIVVDSLTALFRNEFKPEDLQKRQSSLNKHLHDLLNLATKYSMPVVVTNQIATINKDGNFLSIPVGGNIVAHSTTHRLHLYSKHNTKVVEIIDSPSLANQSAQFIITKKGIEAP